jgi:hypothetical protein
VRNAINTTVLNNVRVVRQCSNRSSDASSAHWQSSNISTMRLSGDANALNSDTYAALNKR